MNITGQKNYDNLALASLIIGILSLCAWLLPLCGLPLSLVGLVLGVMGLRSLHRRLAMIGIAFCVLGLLLSLGSATVGILGVINRLFQQ